MSNAMPNPGSEQNSAHKAAKLAVIILSSLIILALIALVVGGVMKLSAKGKAPAPEGASSGMVFALPPGARIVSMDSQTDRLILRVRDDEGEEIDILDTANGHLVGQVKTTPAR
jgi:hypothetical protein